MNKKLIAPIFTAAAMLAVSVSSTFALFTSKDETNIAITSGKVSVKATLDGLKLYSASTTFSDEDEAVLDDDVSKLPLANQTEYRYVEQTEVAPGGATYFLNHGTGKLEPKMLSLNNISAGDKANVTVHIENESNIDVKYRVIVECTDDDETSLRFFSQLRLNAFGEELTQCSKFVTNWQTWNVSETSEVEENISILLPIYSTSQNNTANLLITVEAIQANAYTIDEANKSLLIFADEVVKQDESDPTKLKDIVLSGGSVKVETEEGEVEKVAIQVEVPASVGGVVVTQTGVEKEIEVDDVLTLKVKQEDASDATLALIEEDAGKVYADEYEVNNYEVTVVNQDNLSIKSTNKPLMVKLFAGLNKADTLLGIYHSGERITKVSSMEELLAAQEEFVFGGDKYFYDAVSGYAYIITNHFSPFTAVFTIEPQSADVYHIPTEVGGETVDCMYNFQSFKDADEVYELATRYYHADFVVSFSRDIAEGEVTLMGHYDAYTAFSKQNFVSQNLPALEGGQEVRLLKDGLNVSVTYLELALFGYKNYDCLAAATKGTKTYEHTGDMVALMVGARFDSNAKDFVGYPEDALKVPGFTAGATVNNLTADLTISVTLRLYKTADFVYTATEVSPEEYIDINTITYTFVNENN